MMKRCLTISYINVIVLRSEVGVGVGVGGGGGAAVYFTHMQDFCYLIGVPLINLKVPLTPCQGDEGISLVPHQCHLLAHAPIHNTHPIVPHAV